MARVAKLRQTFWKLAISISSDKSHLLAEAKTDLAFYKENDENQVFEYPYLLICGAEAFLQANLLDECKQFLREAKSFMESKYKSGVNHCSVKLTLLQHPLK